MKFTALQIAEALNGKLEGDENIEVNSLTKIEEGKPGSLSFLSNPKYTSYVYETKASIVIVDENFKPEKEIKTSLIRVKNAYSAFAKLLEMYQQAKKKLPGVSKLASIAKTASIGKDVFIGDFVSIGDNVTIGDNTFIYNNSSIGNDCKIGNNTTLKPGVIVYDECIIGNDCTIHSGSIIGADGFGFAPVDDNEYAKIPQIGNVIIEDLVEIGAQTTVDRATLGSTIIRKGAKIDNLIQIAHNVEIGENTVIAAQTGISGTTKIGKNCMIGGQVGIIGHLTIADGVKIAAQSGIGKSITEENSVVEGSPAFSIRDFQRSYIHFRRLDTLVKRVNQLERK
ncbi:MAG: UDP-3-O-(3-hydroxymyristoyl)glucosamine N-acyltransferase [Bacteroidetes bacterium]|nr:MAG: UDP-3-O-(3-hydroxymyristoyl)glucosamine N-acyltransferase [Bacteroidota bacterium]